MLRTSKGSQLRHDHAALIASWNIDEKPKAVLRPRLPALLSWRTGDNECTSVPCATSTLQQLVKASLRCAKPFTSCSTNAATIPSGQSMAALAHSRKTEIQRCCEQDGNCCHGCKGHCDHPLQQSVEVDVKGHRKLISKDHAVLISHLQADAGHGACSGAWHAQTVSPRLVVGIGLAHHWVSLIPQVAHCNALHTPMQKTLSAAPLLTSPRHRQS